MIDPYEILYTKIVFNIYSPLLWLCTWNLFGDILNPSLDSECCAKLATKINIWKYYSMEIVMTFKVSFSLLVRLTGYSGKS